MIIVVDDEDRENEGDLVMAACHATPSTINFMVTNGKGLVCVPMEKKRMLELEIPQMVMNNTDPHCTAFGVTVDADITTTGISAEERCMTIQTLVDPSTRAGQLRRPGHIFPLQARDGGVFVRAGHTEASVDLAKLAGLPPIGVICEILKKDGTMARMPQLQEFAKEHELKIITIKDLIQYRREKETLVSCEATFDAPTKYGSFAGRSYTDMTTGEAHVVLIKGDVSSSDTVLVRIHSECLTGDALGSLRCDCGEQLHEAMKKLGDSNAGVLIYLKQEGRGIGLHNKLKAYELQDGGQDTYQANISLGFAPDLREYHIAADILRDLGVKSVRLLTNNPEKIKGLLNYGINVIREPLEIMPIDQNYKYLQTKKERFNHLLGQKELFSWCENEND